eukprot:8377741-Pyramimonas_sp.AAC.1
MTVCAGALVEAFDVMVASSSTLCFLNLRPIRPLPLSSRHAQLLTSSANRYGSLSDPPSNRNNCASLSSRLGGFLARQC